MFDTAARAEAQDNLHLPPWGDWNPKSPADKRKLRLLKARSGCIQPKHRGNTMKWSVMLKKLKLGAWVWLVIVENGDGINTMSRKSIARRVTERSGKRCTEGQVKKQLAKLYKLDVLEDLKDAANWPHRKNALGAYEPGWVWRRKTSGSAVSEWGLPIEVGMTAKVHAAVMRAGSGGRRAGSGRRKQSTPVVAQAVVGTVPNMGRNLLIQTVPTAVQTAPRMASQTGPSIEILIPYSSQSLTDVRDRSPGETGDVGSDLCLESESSPSAPQGDALPSALNTSPAISPQGGGCDLRTHQNVNTPVSEPTMSEDRHLADLETRRAAAKARLRAKMAELRDSAHRAPVVEEGALWRPTLSVWPASPSPKGWDRCSAVDKLAAIALVRLYTDFRDTKYGKGLWYKGDITKQPWFPSAVRTVRLLREADIPMAGWVAWVDGTLWARAENKGPPPANVLFSYRTLEDPRMLSWCRGTWQDYLVAKAPTPPTMKELWAAWKLARKNGTLTNPVVAAHLQQLQRRAEAEAVSMQEDLHAKVREGRWCW